MLHLKELAIDLEEKYSRTEQSNVPREFDVDLYRFRRDIAKDS